MQIFDLIVFSARSTLANLESSRDQPNPLQSQCRSDFSLIDHVFHKFCENYTIVLYVFGFWFFKKSLKA